MQNSALYSHEVEGFQVCKTHFLFVLTTGEYADKINKSVNFGFLDYFSFWKRKFYFDQELELHQILAEEIYLEVVSIYGNELQLLYFMLSEEVIEYVVKMRKFSQKNLLSHLLNQRKLTGNQLDDLAKILVKFHEETKVAQAENVFGRSEKTHKYTMDECSKLRRDLALKGG